MISAKATSRVAGIPDKVVRRKWLAGYGLLAPALGVMALMLALPLATLVVLSFWTQTGFQLDRSFTLENYRLLVAPSDKLTQWGWLRVYLEYPVPAILLIKSLLMSLVATIAVIALAYPMAYFIAFRVHRNKALWIIAITIPFWTSYLLRVFSWKVILGYNGAINSGLMAMGVIDAPLEFLLYNPTAVVITLAHSWVAFAVLPIYVSLEKIDRSLFEAATDLGDNRWKRFWRITLPLSAPGTIAAALLVFIPTVGDYVTPTLVGGPEGTMIGSLVQRLFFRESNAPLGAAVSLSMMLVIAVLVLVFLWAIGYRKMRARRA